MQFFRLFCTSTNYEARSGHLEFFECSAVTGNGGGMMARHLSGSGSLEFHGCLTGTQGARPALETLDAWNSCQGQHPGLQTTEIQTCWASLPVAVLQMQSCDSSASHGNRWKRWRLVPGEWNAAARIRVGQIRQMLRWHHWWWTACGL